MKVLLIAPYYNKRVPGESWSTFKWVEGVSAACETTVLTCHRAGWDAAGSPVAATRVIDWKEPQLPGIKGRVAWELKPGYPFFYQKARRWIRGAIAAGERFDVIHQLNPLALRYPSPAAGLGVPYILGPLAGSLPTPEGFGETAREKLWFRKLRKLDRFRLRHDPWLRSTYSGAAAVVGVAPYVRDLLEACGPARFEIMSETGVENVSRIGKRAPRGGDPLRLLFVGRIIRTKGVIDAVRAVARVKADVTLDVLGEGDMLEACKTEASRLGADDRIRFHGRVGRDEVFEWYDRSHVFLFPSFREPSGNVVFEAMSRGLPVVTSSVGGPGYVVDDSCGLKVAPTDPEGYAAGIADAILAMASSERLEILSCGALERMREIALWPRKIEDLLRLYREVGGGALEATTLERTLAKV
jgi:glycosyltransferase involved in cell wall biosynthesis